ncbi:MAG: hypothetical protein J7J86_00110 [Bacteroidales bacterium]|nr:hypothetical protein [Bacteroidales bacterium]
MKNLVKILVVLSVFALFSCNKNFDTIPVNPEPTSMKDLVVDPGFNWKTSKDVDINLNSGSNNIVVYIESLEEDIYQKAFLISGSTYISKINIPAYFTEVNLIFDGNTVKVPITDGAITYSFD